MKIAQVAPLWESVPPVLYGGTERVVSCITEELVRHGHEVTLFASGDSTTNARLMPMCGEALRPSKVVMNYEAPLTAMIEKVFGSAAEFDLIHSHLEFIPFPLARRCRTPMLTTLHARLDQCPRRIERRVGAQLERAQRRRQLQHRPQRHRRRVERGRQVLGAGAQRLVPARPAQRIGEICCLGGGAIQRAVDQRAPAEPGPRQLGLRQIAGVQERAAEIRALEIAAAQVDLVQLGAAQVRAAQIGAGQRPALQVRRAQVRATEVGAHAAYRAPRIAGRTHARARRSSGCGRARELTPLMVHDPRARTAGPRRGAVRPGAASRAQGSGSRRAWRAVVSHSASGPTHSAAPITLQSEAIGSSLPLRRRTAPAVASQVSPPRLVRSILSSSPTSKAKRVFT